MKADGYFISRYGKAEVPKTVYPTKKICNNVIDELRKINPDRYANITASPYYKGEKI